MTTSEKQYYYFNCTTDFLIHLLNLISKFGSINTNYAVLI